MKYIENNFLGLSATTRETNVSAAYVSACGQLAVAAGAVVVSLLVTQLTSVPTLAAPLASLVITYTS